MKTLLIGMLSLILVNCGNDGDSVPVGENSGKGDLFGACPKDMCAVVCSGEALPTGCGENIRCACEPHCPEDLCGAICSGETVPDDCGAELVRCACDPQCPEDLCGAICAGETVADGCGADLVRCGCQQAPSDCSYDLVDDRLILCGDVYNYVSSYTSQQRECEAYWAVKDNEGKPTIEEAVTVAGCSTDCIWRLSNAALFLHCGEKTGFISFEADGCDVIYQLPDGYYFSIEEWKSEHPCD